MEDMSVEEICLKIVTGFSNIDADIKSVELLESGLERLDDAGFDVIKSKKDLSVQNKEISEKRDKALERLKTLAVDVVDISNIIRESKILSKSGEHIQLI